MDPELAKRGHGKARRGANVALPEGTRGACGVGNTTSTLHPDIEEARLFVSSLTAYQRQATLALALEASQPLGEEELEGSSSEEIDIEEPSARGRTGLANPRKRLLTSDSQEGRRARVKSLQEMPDEALGALVQALQQEGNALPAATTQRAEVESQRGGPSKIKGVESQKEVLPVREVESPYEVPPVRGVQLRPEVLPRQRIESAPRVPHAARVESLSQVLPARHLTAARNQPRQRVESAPRVPRAARVEPLSQVLPVEKGMGFEAHPEIVHDASRVPHAERVESLVKLLPVEQRKDPVFMARFLSTVDATGKVDAMLPESRAMAGTSKYKVQYAAPPPFDGCVMTARGVMQWWNKVELFWMQTSPPDPVLYAVGLLIGDAAEWRDTTLRRACGTLKSIPVHTFKQLFMTRFMTDRMRIEARQSLHRLQQGDLSVEQFNAKFSLALDEFNADPLVTSLDNSSQASLYFDALTADMRSSMMSRMCASDLHHIERLMAIATTADNIRTTHAAHGVECDIADDDDEDSDASSLDEGSDGEPGSSGDGHQLAVDPDEPEIEYLSPGMADDRGIRVGTAYLPNKEWVTMMMPENRRSRTCFLCGGHHLRASCESPLAAEWIET